MAWYFEEYWGWGARFRGFQIDQRGILQGSASFIAGRVPGPLWTLDFVRGLSWSWASWRLDRLGLFLKRAGWLWFCLVYSSSKTGPVPGWLSWKCCRPDRQRLGIVRRGRRRRPWISRSCVWALGLRLMPVQCSSLRCGSWFCASPCSWASVAWSYQPGWFWGDSRWRLRERLVLAFVGGWYWWSARAPGQWPWGGSGWKHIQNIFCGSYRRVLSRLLQFSESGLDIAK